MATDSQIAANRRNARKSTGPRTARGKSIVRWNAVNHAFFSPAMLLPGEDLASFNRVRQTYLSLYQPSNQTEFFLVTRMILASWRLTRLAVMEVRVIRQRKSTQEIVDRDHAEWVRGLASLHPPPAQPAPPPPETDDVARAYMNDSEGGDTVIKFARYQASLERSYYRALHELNRGRQERASSNGSQGHPSPGSSTLGLGHPLPDSCP